MQVTIQGALPLATYYIEVSHATSAFAVGGYKADVTYKGALLSLGGIVSTLDYVVNLTNNTLKSATVLSPLFTTQTDQRFDYVYRADLSYSTQSNYYQVQAPATPTANEGWTMHALVWAGDSNMLHPIIHVFDSAGHALPIQVLDNTNGDYTIQGTGYVPKSVYYVEVQAWTPSGANSVGDYVLAVKFDTEHACSLWPDGRGDLDRSRRIEQCGADPESESALSVFAGGRHATEFGKCIRNHVGV